MTAVKSDNSDLERTLWQIAASIDDYFRRLGGSGCYPGYRNWHVPAFIVLKTFEDIKGENFSDLSCTLISSRIEDTLKKNCKSDLLKLDSITINKNQAVEYAVSILGYLRKTFDWQTEIDDWTTFLSVLDIKVPSNLLPEIVRYNGRRIKVVENIKDGKYFLDQNYPLTIIDKQIDTDVGSARRRKDGGYEGYIICGNHNLTVSGFDLRELAKSVYAQILVSEKH